MGPRPARVTLQNPGAYRTDRTTLDPVGEVRPEVDEELVVGR